MVRAEWARRFAIRFTDRTWSQPEKAAFEEGLRLYEFLGDEMSPEDAAECLDHGGKFAHRYR